MNHFFYLFLFLFLSLCFFFLLPSFPSPFSLSLFFSLCFFFLPPSNPKASIFNLPRFILQPSIFTLLQSQPRPISSLKKPIKTHLINPRKLLAFFLFLLHLIAVENLILDFPSFNFRNLTFLGDSHILNDVVSLTHDLSVPTSSVGVVVYNPPIRFFNPDSNIITSFSTHFTFTFTFTFTFSNLNLSSSCDGMSFFLSSTLIGSSGAYLALVNASALTKEEEKHKEKKEERRNRRKKREKKE